MVAGCSAKISKVILFIFNFLVWLVGIILIGMGAYVLAHPSDYSGFFGSGTNTVTVVCGTVIGVGCLVFLVAFAGCCGAIKESTCLLKVYIAVLILLLILEIVGGILALVFRNSIEDVLTTEMKRRIKEDYVGQSASGSRDPPLIDAVQIAGECCGADDYNDWIGSKFQDDNPTDFVPITCCIPGVTDACNNRNGPYIADISKIYTKGCIASGVESFKENFLIIGAVAISMIAAEILAMIFACCVICGIDSDEYK